MLFEQLSGNLIHGVILGAVYGMATMGLSLIFGVLKVVNVGHGAFIMVGAFVLFFYRPWNQPRTRHSRGLCRWNGPGVFLLLHYREKAD